MSGIFDADISQINESTKKRQSNTARQNILLTGNFDVNAIPRAIKELRKYEKARKNY